MSKLTQNISQTIPVEENFLDWQKIQNDLQKTFGKEVYESWIGKVSLNKELNNYIVLCTPTKFVRDWIASRYADKILDLVKKYKKTINRIEFVIDPSTDSEIKKNTNTFKKIASIEDSVLNYNRLNSKNDFENFVVGSSNQLAFTAAKKICERTLNYNPLFIYGGVGMGKTHLLNAIGLNMQKNLNVMFISAERFMYHFVRSIKSKDMVNFKDFFRKANVFIIDDIQFVRGKEVVQEEFFHTFNALMDRGSQIVISSDRSPSNLDRMQDRIISRLSGGLVVDIQPPEYELRIKILEKKFDEIKLTFGEKINLNKDVLNFLASEFQSSLREMIGALNRILAYARLTNNDCCSVAQCKMILKDLLEDKAKTINIENIQKTVASFFQISMQDLLSPRRSRSLARPRQIAMYLAKKYTSKSLPDIGRKFSNRDHTTVIHAVKKINQLIQDDENIKRNITEIKKSLYS
tara:strand:+ start:779 stop:2167 length:1389 start_codon:yes stop_codon:yes gene_type:complete